MYFRGWNGRIKGVGGVAGFVGGGILGDALHSSSFRKPKNANVWDRITTVFGEGEISGSQYHAKAKNIGKLKFPSFKGTLTKVDQLFSRAEQYGDFLSEPEFLSLPHSFNMSSRIFKDFNFNFDVSASDFEVNLYDPNGRLVHNHSNHIQLFSDGTSAINFNPVTEQFTKNGIYTLKTDITLDPRQRIRGESQKDEYIIGEYVNVRRTVNTRRMTNTQYFILRAQGWQGNVKKVGWWDFLK